MTILPVTLAAAGVAPDEVDAVVATFVISILEHDSDFLQAVGQLAAVRQVRVALADLGGATGVGPVRGAALRLLTVLGGADLRVQPWADLAAKAGDVVHVSQHHGHVHLAVGTVDAD